MVTKEILIQYSDLQEEIKEVRDRIEKTENQIERIEREGAVCDKVMGGDGGLQPFKIEGFPYPEYSRNGKSSRTAEICNDRSIKFTTVSNVPILPEIL